MNEIWKEIKNYPMYEISNCGRVRTVKTGTIRKTNTGTTGYAQVCLNIWVNGVYKSKVFRVHRLVAEHFIPKPDGKDLVLHKDSNKMNAHHTNLYWGTHSENLYDAYKNKERSAAKLEGKWELIADLYKQANGKRGTVAGLARKFGVDRKAIYQVLGKTGTI